MNTLAAEIFEQLATLPERTPEQRAADRRSAAILRGNADQPPTRTRHVCCSCVDEAAS